jgi:hypothetical protein
MSAPFFSVVIPTKNRPDYVKDAIASVLFQDERDLECVVSDNFNGPSTRAAVDTFAADPRLRYVRTDRDMNMIDHWEFATGKAVGDYVLVLADRKVLFQGALRRLRQELSRRPEIDVFSVGVQVYDDRGRRMGWVPPRYPTRVYSSRELLDSCLRANLFTDECLDLVFPKTVNGGYRRRFAERVRAGGRRYFNNPGVTTPDYSSFFVNCALVDTALHVGPPLILTQGEADSQGRRFGAGDVEPYLKTLRIEGDLYRGAPLREPFIYNLLIVDFLRIRERFGGHLAGVEPDWPSYFRTVRAEWRLKQKAGRLDTDALGKLEAAWREAGLRLLGAEALAEAARRAEVAPPAPLQPLAHVRDFINHRFSHVRWVNRMMRHRFDRALDAAGFGGVA